MLVATVSVVFGEGCKEGSKFVFQFRVKSIH
jgi:hypothetical protein